MSIQTRERYHNLAIGSGSVPPANPIDCYVPRPVVMLAKGWTHEGQFRSAVKAGALIAFKNGRGHDVCSLQHLLDNGLTEAEIFQAEMTYAAKNAAKYMRREEAVTSPKDHISA